MTTIGTLFTGFGGVDVAAKVAGLDLAWGVELDARIAEVATANLGDHIRVANVLDCDPHDFERVDVLHASPPCPNFSVAKVGGSETALDIALARKVAEFIAVLRPQIFTLENVIAYRHSKSWRIVEQALYGAGYWLHVDHVNACDYGVPQSRKRMIVRAIRGGFVPYLPEPVPWVGWYAAIEDLRPTLTETTFARWQLARLPALLSTTLVAQGGYDGGTGMTSVDAPSPAITANQNQLGIKAWLVNGANASQDLTIREPNEPCMTIIASAYKTPIRSLLNTGRVVAISPRCLARFQSFPDSYILPDNRSLAAKGIGNAVCPLLYQRIIEPLVRSLS